MDSTKSSELRRSCVSCRQRKMRCSGDLPCCTTCRQREKPCMYEPLAIKSRFKMHQDPTSSSSSSSSAAAADKDGLYDGPVLCSSSDETVQQVQKPLIGEELIFLFGALSTVIGANGYDASVKRTNVPLVTYENVFSTICTDLVDLTMYHLNERSSSKDEVHFTRYTQSIFLDQSAEIYEGLEFGDAEQWFSLHGPPSANQIEQMLELAFSHHPFAALIVPKTPFMRDHHEGMPNSCILWLLCGVGLELGVPSCAPNALTTFHLPSPQACVQLAWRILYNARQTLRSDGIFIAQALLLFGFRLLCQGRSKQATCFFLLCAQTISTIVVERARSSPGEVKINGVRSSEVENQAIDNMYWITHSVLLWMWMQLNARREVDLSRFVRPAPMHAVAAPSTVLCDNALYKLDYVSGNFTSLIVHLQNSRSLSVVAHLCNIICVVTQTDVRSLHASTPSTMYAAVSAKLLYQTKSAISPYLTPMADEHANKAIIASAYLFAICLCEPHSGVQAHHADVVERCRTVLDVAKGMMRDCQVESTSASVAESALIRQFFTDAYVSLTRITSAVRESANDDLNGLTMAGDGTEAGFMQSAYSILQAFGRCTELKAYIPSLVKAPSKASARQKGSVQIVRQQSTSAFNASLPAVREVGSTHTSFAATSHAAPSSSNSTSDAIPVPFRARSFSDSAAIYCATSTDTSGLNLLHQQLASTSSPSSTSSSFAHATGSSMLFSPTYAGNQCSSHHEESASSSVLSDPPSTLKRGRTASLHSFSAIDNVLVPTPATSSTIHPQAFPSTPLSGAPQSDLALLSETASVTLQSMLQQYSAPHRSHYHFTGHGHGHGQGLGQLGQPIPHHATGGNGYPSLAHHEDSSFLRAAHESLPTSSMMHSTPSIGSGVHELFMSD